MYDPSHLFNLLVLPWAAPAFWLARSFPLSQELRTFPLPETHVLVGTPEHHRVYASSTPSTILSGRKKRRRLDARVSPRPTITRLLLTKRNISQENCCYFFIHLFIGT